MLGFQVVAIAGFSMLAATKKPSVQYAGTVLAAIGIYPQIPLGMAWNSANIGGSLKRGTGIAMQVSREMNFGQFSICIDSSTGHGRQLWWHYCILRLHQPRRTSLHQGTLFVDWYHYVSYQAFRSTVC